MSKAREPMRVDAHQHFWHYTEEEFGWIDDAMAAIRHDFLPADLKPLLDRAGIEATVAVQARQSLEETAWLLQLADENSWIVGVVGWVPLVDPSIGDILHELASYPKLKGLRHVLQGEPDEYMARPDFNAGLALLQSHTLTYDILILERQLPAAIQLVDRHPHQAFVLDHVAKPLIAAQQFEPWSTHIRDLARRPNVVCKLSGMVTESDFQSWTLNDLRPYVETVLEAFGPSRLLFGSDWPVCTVGSTYDRWVTAVQSFVSELSSHEQTAIFGGNAVKVYRLENTSNLHEVKSA